MARGRVRVKVWVNLVRVRVNLVRARVRARVNPNPSPNPSQVATSGEAATFVLYARDARGVPVGFGGEKFEVAMQPDPDPDPAGLDEGAGRVHFLVCKAAHDWVHLLGGGWMGPLPGL